MSVNQLDSGQWQVRWYDAAGRRRTSSYPTKKLATAAEAKAIEERSRGVLPRRKTLMRDFLVEWERSVRGHIEESTWKHAYEPHLRRYIRPRLGDLELGRIDALTVQRFIDGLADVDPPLAAASRQRVFATLRAMLNQAAAWGMCEPLAPRAVKLPQQAKVEQDVPGPVKIYELADAIDPDYRAAVLLAGVCGLRAGEVFALRVSDVDWDAHRIRVRRSRENHTRAEKTTKSRRARWVTLPALVAEALRVQLDEYPPVAGRVFSSPRGMMVAHPNWYRQVWEPARLAVGLPELRFHDLRHAAPTIMALAGWGPKRVQLEMGHSSAAFTLDRYGHVFHEEESAGRERLDQVLAAAIAAAKTTPMKETT